MWPDWGTVVLASHVAYQEPRAAALAGLAAAGVPPRAVVVVLNGAAADGLDDDGAGPRVLRLTSNLFEYSAFFVPRLVPGADDCVLVHDTCAPGPDFAARAAGALRRRRELGADVAWCSPTGQCNLCAFGPGAAAAAQRLWGGLTTLDKRHAVAMEHDPRAWLSLKGADDLAQTYAPEAAVPRGTARPYASGRERAVLWFPDLDLTKYYYDLETHPSHPNEP